jgi:hypothetical protein
MTVFVDLELDDVSRIENNMNASKKNATATPATKRAEFLQGKLG